MALSLTRSNPPAVRAPTGYAHAIEIRGAERRLIISGQVGMAADGSIPETGGGQIAQALANLRAVLEANEMTVTNVVNVLASPGACGVGDRSPRWGSPASWRGP